MGRRNAKRRGKLTFWTCHECFDSGLTVFIEICPSCGHARCVYCEQCEQYEQYKHEAGKINISSPGSIDATEVKNKIRRKKVKKEGDGTTVGPMSMHNQRATTDGEVEGHENPYTNHHQDRTRATQIGPSTDSEYASATHTDFEHGQIARPQDDTGNTQFLGPTDEELGTVKNSLSEDVQRLTSMESHNTKTVYSDASSLRNVESESYISELANDLMRKARSEQPSPETIQRVIVILPKLLKAFALKVGYNAPSQMHRDVMWFVHKNRE